jgi:hypothetical protein
MEGCFFLFFPLIFLFLSFQDERDASQAYLGPEHRVSRRRFSAGSDDERDTGLHSFLNASHTSVLSVVCTITTEEDSGRDSVARRFSLCRCSSCMITLLAMVPNFPPFPISYRDTTSRPSSTPVIPVSCPSSAPSPLRRTRGGIV